MIKAVIFDLDGTLLDTIEDIANTCNQLLEKRGYPSLPIKDYKIYVGKGVKNLLIKLIEVLKMPEQLLDELMSDYYEIYPIESTKTTKIYPGISEMLETMKKMDIKINVLSNKPHEQVIDLMPKYFSENTFDIIYGKHEGVKAKPDPTLLKKMMKELKVKKSEVLYVGDTKTDMETALNASVASVGVLWGFREETELVQSRASYIITHPKEMIHIINEKNNDPRSK